MITLRVLTIGTFDGLHYGHLRIFERACQFGELHVGVNDDSFVESYKGRLPTQPMILRARVVAGLRVVHRTHFNDGPGIDLIRVVRPDIIVIGSDWHEHGYLSQLGITQEELDELNIAVVYLPRTPGVSTSELRA